MTVPIALTMIREIKKANQEMIKGVIAQKKSATNKSLKMSLQFSIEHMRATNRILDGLILKHYGKTK